MKKDSTGIPIITAFTVLFLWCGALSSAIYSDHATIATFATSAATKEDIKSIINDALQLRQQDPYRSIISQARYNVSAIATTSTE